MGAGQALVAASVGAEYLAPYLGRMDDAGKDGGLTLSLSLSLSLTLTLTVIAEVAAPHSPRLPAPGVVWPANFYKCGLPEP